MRDSEVVLSSRGRTDAFAPGDDVQRFFDRMGRALVTGDTTTVGQLFETPALVLGDDGAVPVSSVVDVDDLFGGAREAYHRRGVYDTRAEILGVDWATDRIAVVEVRWPWLDADGRQVGAEASMYILRLDDHGELKLRAVLMRGEDRAH